MPADQHRPATDPGAEPGRGGTACGCVAACACGARSAADGRNAAVVAEFLDPALPRHAQLEEALDRTPTGAPLARLLDALDPRTLGDYDLEELAAGYARMAGWAHANLAAVAVELARRPGMAPRPDPRARGGTRITPERVAATALSARLQRSPQDTAALVREGCEFSGALAATGEALRAGRISVPAARAIAARLGDQVTWVSQPVQDFVLPRAEHSTVTQVKADLERALLRVDPEHAQDRRDTARTQRRVTHPRALPDQMAEVHVVLPAEHAVGIDTALERAARAGGDPRTLDQLRADGLVDSILTGTPLARRDADGASPAAVPGFLPAPRDGSGARAGSTATATATDEAAGPRDPRTHVLVTVPLSSLIGEDDAPAELAGFGPIDATTARALAQGGVWRRLVTDDLSGSVLDVGRTTYRPPAALADHVRFRDRTCTYPGCSVPAQRCDLDHGDDWSPAPDDPRPPGTTSHTNLGPACPRHHRAKHQARFAVRQPAAGVHEWTDPTGHRYRTRPGRGVPPEHLTGPRRVRDSSRAVQDSSAPAAGTDEPTPPARRGETGRGATDDPPPF